MIIKIMDGALDYDLIPTEGSVKVRCLFTIDYYQEYTDKAVAQIQVLKGDFELETNKEYFKDEHMEFYNGNVYAIIYDNQMIITCNRTYILNNKGQTIERIN